MLEHFKNINTIIYFSLKSLRRYPILLSPLLLLWLLYMPLVSHLAFQVDVKGASPLWASLGLFLVPMVVHAAMGLACAALVGMLKALAAGGNPHPIMAIRQCLKQYKYTIAIIGIMAGAANMMLIMMQAVHAPGVGGVPDELRTYSIENLARILLSTGSENILQIEALKYALIKKAIRLTLFLAMIAMVWEDLKAYPSFERGLQTIDRNIPEALGGLVFTTFAVYVLSLPAGLIVSSHDNGSFPIADWGWILLIIYAGMIWSITLYLEQMFLALLFQWQMAREKRGPKTKLGDSPMPKIHRD